MTSATAGLLNHVLGRLGTTSDVLDVPNAFHLRSRLLVSSATSKPTRLGRFNRVPGASKRPSRPYGVPADRASEAAMSSRTKWIRAGDDNFKGLLGRFTGLSKRHKRQSSAPSDE